MLTFERCAVCGTWTFGNNLPGIKRDLDGHAVEMLSVFLKNQLPHRECECHHIVPRTSRNDREALTDYSVAVGECLDT